MYCTPPNSDNSGPMIWRYLVIGKLNRKKSQKETTAALHCHRPWFLGWCWGARDMDRDTCGPDLGLEACFPMNMARAIPSGVPKCTLCRLGEPIIALTGGLHQNMPTVSWHILVDVHLDRSRSLRLFDPACGSRSNSWLASGFRVIFAIILCQHSLHFVFCRGKATAQRHPNDHCRWCVQCIGVDFGPGS